MMSAPVVLDLHCATPMGRKDRPDVAAIGELDHAAGVVVTPNSAFGT